MTRSTRLLRQLGHPSGLFGRLVLNRLNAMNRGMNRLTLERLEPMPEDRFLEIGFGGGALLDDVIRAGVRSVSGVDASALAVERASRRLRRHLDAGTLELTHSIGEVMPYETAAFTSVCCVNVIYFWADVDRALAEVRRVTASGGRFTMTWSEDSPDEVTRFPVEDVTARLRRAGFSESDSVTDRDRENGTYHCSVSRG